MARRYICRGDRKEHENKLFDVLKKLEDAGYRASERKSELFLNKTKWLGHEIDETVIKLNKEKVKAILDLKHPENRKQLKSFLGAIQYLAKFLPRLSEKTEKLIAIDRFSKWPTAKLCKLSENKEVLYFSKQNFNLCRLPEKIKTDEGGVYIERIQRILQRKKY